MVRDLFDLSGHTVLITGSSRGIGRSLALGFAEHGADVAVHCRSTVSQAEVVAAGAASYGVKSCVIQADLAAEDAPAACGGRDPRRLHRRSR